MEFATSDGSATNGADYVEQNSGLWFSGETNLTITIFILNDNVAKLDETFSISLFDPFETAEPGTITNAIITILDNDGGLNSARAPFGWTRPLAARSSS